MSSLKLQQLGSEGILLLTMFAQPLQTMHSKQPEALLAASSSSLLRYTSAWEPSIALIVVR
jgi:hypothetical protein